LKYFNRIVLFVVLGLALVFYLTPIYVMVVNGLKAAGDVSLSQMWQLPEQLGQAGFSEAWDKLSPNLLNSLLMVVPATIISSLIGAMNGFILSKWRFKGSNLLFTLMLFGFFIPYQAVLLPMVKFLQSVGLYGTIPGLILVHVIYGIPITTLIFRNFYVGIPSSVIEAARVDGAGMFYTFAKIVFPLSIPGFIVSFIFQFTNIWNDFLLGITVVPNPRTQPVTVALNNLSGSFSVDWNVVMAGAVVAALPTAIVYLLLSRYFVKGLVAGSVKG